MDQSSHRHLDALEHFLSQVLNDPEMESALYASQAPEDIVLLCVGMGILIDVEDFCALLISGASVYWLFCGTRDPLMHLRKIFKV